MTNATQNIGSACAAAKQLLQLPDTELHRGAGPQRVEMQLAHAVSQTSTASVPPTLRDLQLSVQLDTHDLLDKIHSFGNVSNKQQLANDARLATPRKSIPHQRHSASVTSYKTPTKNLKKNSKAIVDNLIWQELSSMCDDEPADGTQLAATITSPDAPLVSTPKLEFNQLFSPNSMRSCNLMRSCSSDDEDQLSLSEYCQWRVDSSAKSRQCQPLREAFNMGLSLAAEKINLPDKKHKRERASRSRSRASKQSETVVESAGTAAAKKLSSSGVSDEPQRLQRIVNKLELLRKRY